MPISDQQTIEWDDILARLLAFRQHLPNHYEIEERLVLQYHSILEEMESVSSLDLTKYRVPPDDIRPKIDSVSMGTRRRPGRINYSDGNYCLRSTLLMKLDALIQYFERRPPFEHSQSGASLKVFLCHSSGDREAVRKLYSRLRTDGFTPWLDEENILPGQDWDSEIRGAVRNSHVVIVCLSKSSITKEGYVQKELKLALDVAEEKPESSIFLIPGRLEDCEVPRRLVGWQWVDLFDLRGYERLVAALRAREVQLRGRPNTPRLSRPAGKRPRGGEPQAPLSLAEKMKRALAEYGAAEEADRVQRRRQQELREAARKAGPVQFDTLAALLKAKGDVLNNERLAGFPEFKYVAVNHRLDAGKYAIELTPYAALDSYSVGILAGLHPSAAQLMAEIPDIPTHEQLLIASIDQDGFFWRDPSGQKCDANTVLDRAMETVCELILADIRQR